MWCARYNASIEARPAGFHDRAATGVDPSTLSALAIEASRAPDAPIEFILMGAGGADSAKNQQRVTAGAKALSE